LNNNILILEYISYRFENIKKEQEEEAAKRVAEERNKRAANDQKSTSNGHDKFNHSEIPSAPKQTIREPSPPAVHRPETPPQVFNQTIYENMGNQFETQPSTTINEGLSQFVGNVNVSSLLRQRKTSSSSSKNENEDDEWAIDHKSHNQQQSYQRSPSPAVQSEQPSNNNHNEGIKGIARYSYQKSK
jgi:hypothetical protein